MTDQRSRSTTAFCVLNVLFGTMLLMSVAFHVTFAVLGIGDLGDYMQLKVGISLAGTILGIWSGVWLLKQKKHADLLAIAFAACLLSFEGLLLYERTFPPLVGSLVVLYAVASAGYFVRQRTRRPRSQRSVERTQDKEQEIVVVKPRRLESQVSAPPTTEDLKKE